MGPPNRVLPISLCVLGSGRLRRRRCNIFPISGRGGGKSGELGFGEMVVGQVCRRLEREKEEKWGGGTT